jgi:hypothetical protein
MTFSPVDGTCFAKWNIFCLLFVLSFAGLINLIKMPFLLHFFLFRSSLLSWGIFLFISRKFDSLLCVFWQVLWTLIFSIDMFCSVFGELITKSWLIYSHIFPLKSVATVDRRATFFSRWLREIRTQLNFLKNYPARMQEQ